MVLSPEHSKMEWALAHGMIWVPMRGARVRSACAWLQSLDDEVVLDCCRGFFGRMGPYYRQMDVDLSRIQLYDRRTARSLSVRHGHAGPWDDRLVGTSQAGQHVFEDERALVQVRCGKLRR